MKRGKGNDRWGRDAIEKNQGKERLAAGTRGAAERGRKGASSRESWGRLGPATWAPETRCRGYGEGKV
jgi:hypothetical protein